MTTNPIPAAPVERRRAIVAASLVWAITLSVLMAACGGSSGSAGEANPEPAQTGSIVEPSPEPTAPADTGVTPGPGIKEFGLTEEEYAAHIESVQSLIASCMTEAGFEYVPADVEAVALAQSAVRVEPGYTREEYKSQWGFGATTRFDNVVKEIELGPQNLGYFEGLSEADQVAYERTLWGEDTDATFAFSFDEEDFSSTGGCTRKAVEQVFTPEQLSATYVNPKDVLVESDPRVVEAEANWVSCMEDAGYEGYLDQDEIIGELEERLDALLEEDDPETLTGPRAEELERLQEEEIAISLADLECQIENLDPVIEEVEIELFGVKVSG